MMELVVGLEVHVKLNSKNKLFCSCSNEQDFETLSPNSNVCPVCTAQPGALPVVQQEALEKAILLGKALGCTISPTLSFDRKSYFYPDLPTGYQITQLHNPVSTDGMVNFFVNQFTEKKSVSIKQAHLENDTGKAIHDGDKSYLDFNRAGTPLVEIVTNPDFRSDEEVVEYLKEIQRIVRINDIGNADMEKGQMRCDVNISIRPAGSGEFGTRVELKNINSFGAIKRAINHEFSRQKTALENGETLFQETRSRDDQAGSSTVMRSKEDALDYRYFPEPDLPRKIIPESMIFEQNKNVKESGFEIIERYTKNYQFNKEFVNGLINDIPTMIRFETGVRGGFEPKLVAKWIVGPINGYINQISGRSIETLPFGQTEYFDFLEAIASKILSEQQAKTVMDVMLKTGDTVKKIMNDHGFDQQETIDLSQIAQEVATNHAGVVAEYKAGKVATIGFLVGQGMKLTGGKADPNAIKSALEQLLSS
ncbi:MAG TPA: Asp-tRNA(Asn)/Glu-tRNA(Gln) amidotransferase subunit GatB [Candidatus Absconditabacterales bacterium]|nr:Asp-tRNA(Asn)/Glu-tRNA(Gln) amidotransferase subunit GatB [Candidatus Absconditabacterales bacterium]